MSLVSEAPCKHVEAYHCSSCSIASQEEVWHCIACRIERLKREDAAKHHPPLGYPE